MSRKFHEDDTLPESGSDIVFVFGSNLAGRHGKGAAKVANARFGAERGVGVGLVGHSYAIPTKDGNLRVLPIETVRKHVTEFLVFAARRSDLSFFLTRVGCGLAGYADAQIGPMFSLVSENVDVPSKWEPYIGRHLRPRP